MLLNKLERQVIDISYKNKTTHIGSCLSCVNIIDNIYKVKDKKDQFVLSNGHAFLALAVVLEKYEGKNAEDLVKRHGTHPNRNLDDGIYVSTGSLGQGLPIAVGMAIADKSRNVYVLVSDGEMAEGSMWEALRIAAELRLENLRITLCANGLGGYSKIDPQWLDLRMQEFYPSLMIETPMFKYPSYLNGLSGHYVCLNEDQYSELIKEG